MQFVEGGETDLGVLVVEDGGTPVDRRVRGSFCEERAAVTNDSPSSTSPRRMENKSSLTGPRDAGNGIADPEGATVSDNDRECKVVIWTPISQREPTDPT
ncbi:hypothetical protein [Rhodococcus sp. ZPP]|uniref:hypothetical protein n=1 Tax=Rhodococcus sp. ZPP TaxID=2749906 RepID=UPI001FCD1F80|nr:hypothetical protein [Rhodococcus sp. ZPP]